MDELDDLHTDRTNMCFTKLFTCICLFFPFWGWDLDVDLIVSVPEFNYLLITRSRK